MKISVINRTFSDNNLANSIPLSPKNKEHQFHLSIAKTVGIFAVLAVFAFSSAVCFAQTINNPEALKTYLDSQPANGE